MTFKELAIEILKLPAVDMDRPCGVWPPAKCPNASFVEIVGMGKTPTGTPVIVTGKKPEIVHGSGSVNV